MDKKEMEDALVAHKETIKALIEEVKKAKDADKAELQKALDDAKADRDVMQKQLDAIETAQKTAKLDQKEKEDESFDQSVRKMVSSDEYKKAVKEGFPKGNNSFEVKIDTSIITGNVNRTQQSYMVNFAPEDQMAFIPYLRNGFIGKDRNQVLWVDGAYTSNVGYVGEGTGQQIADTGTAVEKTREMAKISAVLPITAEMLEDADYIASAFRSKMSEKAQLFLDGEAYDGDGADGGANTKHIYGLKGHATAFNATTAGVDGSVTDANIGDLVDAMILQAEKANFRGSNILWMNPSDFYKFRTAKNKSGDYVFLKDVNGNYSVQGLNVVRSNRVAAGELLLGDTSKLQYWTKRAAEIKFSQMNGTNFVDDVYTAVMFVRSQVVVETFDKLSLIAVADIDAAVTAIDAGV